MCWAGPNQQWLIAGERYFDSLAALIARPERDGARSMSVRPTRNRWQHLPMECG
ncbi:hypothetical protein RBWH47_02357 [Rhodopirellula baltica WH47]|uniref:Uncharacterized protein n=2 Tax=Rhodopirellula baltica TaxID=265606 RepID=F2APE1_RHOBT|nr:hypothetical protein RBWH47_02357 [Rhodopirellula baltica WH47]